MLVFSREATSEIYTPRVYFLIIYFQIYFAICLFIYLPLLFLDPELVEIASEMPFAALMFEDFASMLRDAAWQDASIRASERTQELLDAVWLKALQNERGN
jgi:hypothetical protein